MRVTHINNIDFSISQENAITCTSVWELLPDENFEQTWPSFEAEVKAWAGDIGDDWRVPNPDSKGYTADNTRIITAIECKSKARWCYEVSYTGRVKDLEARMTEYSEDINNREEYQKNATFLVETEYLEAWCPNIGDVLTWAGELFCCDNISKRKNGLNNNQWEVSIQAVDMRLLMLGNPTFSRNSRYESVKTAVWRVHNDEYENFLAEHNIGTAAGWAGDKYYITDMNADPRGNYGYDVTLEAKHIEVRCVEVRREEVLKSYDTADDPEKEITYVGTWQVHADSLAEFQDQVGLLAAEWAESNFIITKSTPTLVNPMEYEVVMEAVDKDQFITQSEGSIGTLKSDYSSELEVTPFTMEMILTPQQLGWMKEGVTDASQGSDSQVASSGVPDTSKGEVWVPYKESYLFRKALKDVAAKKNQWNADTDCPFVIAGSGYDRSGSIEFANKPYQCICVEITKYTKGDPAQNLSALKTRIESYPRIIKWGPIRGLTASWKRIRFEVEKVKDSRGNAWWKESYTMQAAPNDWRWNEKYVEKAQ